MFAYCRNNPVIRKDASGTDDIRVTDANEDGNPLNDYIGRGGAGGGGNSSGTARGSNGIGIERFSGRQPSSKYNSPSNSSNVNSSFSNNKGDALLPSDYYIGKKAPKQSTPMSTYHNYSYDPKTGEWEHSTAYYDIAGRQAFRIDWTNHGRTDHGNPHVHIYYYDNIYRDGISRRID